jgi:LysM repeat protein
MRYHQPKVSGSEPLCKHNLFSEQNGIVRNNCYAYALQIGSKKGPYNFKLQPGDLSSKKYFGLSSCHDVRDRVLDDLEVIGGYLQKNLSKPCAPNHYLIAMVLSKERDYHFLLFHQDIKYVAEAGETRASIARKFKVPVRNVQQLPSYAPGQSVYIKNARVWSHKRGTAEAPTLLDSEGKIIKDPRTSTFNYGYLHYNTFCTFFCVKRRDRGPSTIRNDRHGNVIVSRVNKNRKKRPRRRR